MSVSRSGFWPSCARWSRSGRRPPPRPCGATGRRLTLVAAVAAAAAVAFAVLAVGDRTPLRNGPEWAEAARRVAESRPRLTIGEPG